MLRTIIRLQIVAVGIILASQLFGCASTPLNPRELQVYQPKLPPDISSVDAAIDDLARLMTRRKAGMYIEYDPVDSRPACDSAMSERLTKSHGVKNITWWRPQQVAIIDLPGIRIYREFMDIPVSPVYFDSLRGFEIYVRKGASTDSARLIELPQNLHLWFNNSEMGDVQKIADDLLYIQQNYDRYRQEQRARFEEQAARYRTLAVKPPLPEEMRKFIVQANAMTRQKDFAGALAAFQKAIDNDPVSYPEAYFNRALLHAKEGRSVLAAERMKQYLLLAPDAKDARSAQDKIYEWEGMLGK